MLCDYLAYSLQDFQQTPTLQSDYGYIPKRKCEACSRLLQEGCGKTRTKINDTNPHT